MKEHIYMSFYKKQREPSCGRFSCMKGRPRGIKRPPPGYTLLIRERKYNPLSPYTSRTSLSIEISCSFLILLNYTIFSFSRCKDNALI